MNLIRKPILLLLIGVLFCAFGAKAQYWGADIGWEEVGEDSFLVKVRAYYDCSSSPKSPGSLEINAIGGSYTNSVALSAGTSLDITPLCAGKTGKCSSTSNPDVSFGNTVITYTALAVLPSADCRYSISWKVCCLSSEVTTGPSGDVLLEAEVDRCGDELARFSFGAPPQMLICKNTCQTLAHPLVNDESKEAAEDSVAYSMPALYSYNTGYSSTEPVKYNGKKDDAYSIPQCAGFHLNTATGTLNFKPTQEEVSSYVIQADMYRFNSSGQRYLAGRIMRTYTMYITEDYGCATNKAPEISGATEQYLLAGQEQEFKITVSDPDGQDVVLQALNSLPGASITSDGAKPNPTLTIKWKPSTAQVRTAPYILDISATDANCPVPGVTKAAVQVYVLDKPEMKISCDQPQQCISNNLFRFTLKVLPPGVYTYKWEASDGRQFQTSQPQLSVGFISEGVHSVSAKAYKDGNLFAEAEMEVIVNNLTPYFVYTPDGWPSWIRFIDKTQHYGKNKLKYHWDFGDGDTSTEEMPVHHFRKYTTYHVTMKVTDPLSGCTAVTAYNVLVSVMPKAEFTVNRAVQCLPTNSFVFTNLCQYGDSINYQWITDDGRSFYSKDLNSTDLTYTYKDPGEYTVRCIARYDFPAEANTMIMKVTVDPLIAQPEIFGDFEVDQYDTILYRLENGSQFDSIYWTISGGYIYDGQFWKDAKIIWDDTAGGSITVYVRSHTGCILQFTRNVKVKYRPWTGNVGELAGVRGRLSLYPNPGKGLFMLSAEDVPVGPVVVNIYNSVGQRLFTQGFLSAGSTWTRQLDLSALPPGIYSLHLAGPVGGSVVKLMIRE